MKIKWFNRDENFSYEWTEAVTNYPAFDEVRVDRGCTFTAHNPAYNETHHSLTVTNGSLGGVNTFQADDPDLVADALGNITRSWVQDGRYYPLIKFTVIISNSESGSKFFKNANNVISTELFTSTLISFEAGSLGNYLLDTFETIVSGKIASDDTIQYLSANNKNMDSPSVTLNPNWFMSAYDLSAASVMDSRNNDDNPSAVLITPRHAFAAKHYGVTVGGRIIFRRPDGTYQEVTVLDETVLQNADTGQSTDLNILYLSADVTGITPAKILPVDWVMRYCPTMDGELVSGVAVCRLPILCRTGWNLDNTIGNFSGSKIRMGSHCPVSSNPDAVKLSHDIARIATLAPWSNLLIGGDSGSPAFMPINGELVALFTNYGSTSSEDIAYNKVKIEAAMNTMAGTAPGTYQLTHPDMTSFKDYII